MGSHLAEANNQEQEEQTEIITPSKQQELSVMQNTSAVGSTILR